MGIKLVRASAESHDTVLRNLYQFYLYEFSRFTDEWRVLADGRFAETDLETCWDDPYRRIFLIEVDDALAGFAIVDVGIPVEAGSEETVNELAELFVMPPYQRRGLGEQVACQLFDQFRGRWELFIVETNAAALSFWRKVIERYTGNLFTEVHRPQENDFMHAFDNTLSQ
jgi:predicted acetyltransferase